LIRNSRQVPAAEVVAENLSAQSFMADEMGWPDFRDLQRGVQWRRFVPTDDFSETCLQKWWTR